MILYGLIKHYEPYHQAIFLNFNVLGDVKVRVFTSSYMRRAERTARLAVVRTFRALEHPVFVTVQTVEYNAGKTRLLFPMPRQCMANEHGDRGMVHVFY